MKYGLIGCGRIATNHVKAVLNNNLEFVAACDIEESQINNLLAKHGLDKDTAIKRYIDYKKMIEQNKLDLVAIATESGNHAEIALDCIDHGINCIIEKPIAMSIQEADQIIRRAEEKGVKVSACHQNRFNRAVQETRTGNCREIGGASGHFHEYSEEGLRDNTGGESGHRHERELYVRSGENHVSGISSG